MTGAAVAAAVPDVAPSVLTGLALPSTFVDAPVGTPFFEHIEWLARHGISRGSVQADGSVLFQPAAPVRREAMAAFLYRLMGEPVFAAPVTSPLADCPGRLRGDRSGPVPFG